MPLKIMVRLATAPSCGPIWRAALMPKPWAAAPNGAPLAMRMRSGSKTSNTWPSKIPNKPVITTKTPVNCVEPPRWRVTSRANGVDTERASRLCAVLASSPSKRSSNKLLASEAAIPAQLPRPRASQCFFTSARY
jgi:hypothetical protein